jgi:chorismate synthase
VPTVSSARTGAIQHAWLVLLDCGIEASVVEIGYYDPDTALQFAEARLRVDNPDEAHRSTQKKALRLLIDRLRTQTDTDGDRFAVTRRSCRLSPSEFPMNATRAPSFLRLRGGISP